MIEQDNTENLEGSYYQAVSDSDIITKFRPLLQSGGWKLRDEDGKICATGVGMTWDTPWHHVVHDAFFDCQRWHKILFDLFSVTMPPGSGFVPSSCQQCWKVVVRPKTLLGLFSLLDLQKFLALPSKCGIETRNYVNGLYGGYFYNHSLEFGLENYKLVREKVNETPHLGEDTSVVLKRACTEFEMRLGDSSEWKVTPKQLQIETTVNKWFVRNNVVREQPAHAIANVHRKWIEYAYSNGDETYKHFTGGKPLYKAVKTYHHLAEKSGKTLATALKKFERKQHFPYDL